MNDLEKYFYNNPGRLIHKWLHYFEIYDSHFKRFRGKEIVLVEIGVFNGGSLQMWRDYFGDTAKIYGIDIDSRVSSMEEENIKIIIGSQADRQFLRRLKKELPPIDILIDDGGHKMIQQIVTFEELFEKVKPDGVYLCEDLLTSYQLLYGGGYRRMGTFIEHSKNLIDKLNAYSSEQDSLRPDKLTKSIHSLHYYDSMLVVEKRLHNKPVHMQTGISVIDLAQLKTSRAYKIYFWLLRNVNLFLRALRLPSYKFNK